MATLNELFETYINDNYEGTMSQAAIVKAYELLLGLTGNFADKAARVQYWVDKDLAVSEFLDEFLAAAARLSEANAAAWGETTTERTAVVNAAQNAVSTSLSLEEVGTVVANTRTSFDSQTFTLTAGVDQGKNFTGGVADDTFTADYDSSATSDTLTALDVIDGGEGTDTLAITSQNGNNAYSMASATISNIEKITIAGSDNVTADTSIASITGVESLTVTKSVDASLTADATTDVTVSGASGTISVLGGNDISITDATTNKAISVGDNSATTGSPAGAVTVTDTDNTGATNAITVTGGTDVTVTATADEATSGNIVVGHATNGQASGAVAVTQNSTSNGTAMTAGNITVTGGSTVDITANMTNTAVKGGSAGAITAGAVAVTGGDSTTAVTVTQNATATDYASEVTTAGTKETAVVTFGALKAGEEVFISEGAATGASDLSFVASKDLTAEEVAQAIASLTSADSHASGGVTANGYYDNSLDAGWVSSAVSGATVTFTATTVGDKTNLVVETDATGSDDDSNDDATNDADFGVVVTDGVAQSSSAAVDVTADLGTVTIDDNATASITTVTLDGYDTATIGDTTALSALTTVSLSNSAGANVIDNGAATSLTLNLDKITGATDLDNGAASLTSLTINASGSASSTALTANTVKTLTVNAGANLTVTPTALAALETLNISGAGDVAMGDISTATTTISAGTATGAISATIDGTKAAVTTGSGNDSITSDTDAIAKNIDLGAGDDTLTLNAGDTTTPTSTVTGGEGDDTIAMTTTSAEAFDANTNFASSITSFERLEITDATSATIEADNLGFDYVTYGGAATGDLNDFADNGTVVFQAASNNATVTLDDATGSSNATSVVLDNEAVNNAASQAYAVYTIDLTGAVASGASETLTVGGVTLFTSAGTENAGAIATAIDGNTITISGVTYDIDATSSSAVTLTAQTYTDVVTASLTIAGSYNTLPTDTTADLTTVGEDGDTSADVDFGTVTIAGVETINLNTNDTTTSSISAVDENTLALVADSVKTLNIDGASDLALTTTAANLVTINATDMTGVLTYTSAVENQVVNAGSGTDSLTADANGVKINGGEGDDTITINDNRDLVVVDGGAGADTFVIGTSASSNKSNYAVFENVGSGDVFDFANDTTFAAAQITLSQGATESTQAYLDQAVTDLSENEIGWFQYDGNTFMVVDEANSSNAFTDGSDIVVMINGLIDLGTGASFNISTGTVEIA